MIASTLPATTLPAGAVTPDGDARTGRFHCNDCGLFLSNACDWTEYESGVDEEWEFGQSKYGGDIIRSGWSTVTEVRVCKACGWENKREEDD